MATDDQPSRGERPIDDVCEKPGHSLSGRTLELQRLLEIVLSALPVELLDRLRESRVRFFAGDEMVGQYDPIRPEVRERVFPEPRVPSGLIYLNAGQLLEKRPPEESLFLIARVVARVLSWQDPKSTPTTERELLQLAEEMAQRWGFERPRVNFFSRICNAIGLCCGL